VGAAVGGYIFFDQQLSKMTMLGMAIIVIGVVVMNLGGASH
jgi:small multidrug resistance pump